MYVCVPICVVNAVVVVPCSSSQVNRRHDRYREMCVRLGFEEGSAPDSDDEGVHTMRITDLHRMTQPVKALFDAMGAGDVKVPPSNEIRCSIDIRVNAHLAVS